MNRTLVAAALVVPVVLGAAACSSTVKKPGTVKGTFPYCAYQPVEDGVFVPEENPRQCVVDDTRESDDRSGYSGGHTVIAPRGTAATRTPLPTTAKPSTIKPTPAPAASKTLGKSR